MLAKKIFFKFPLGNLTIRASPFTTSTTVPVDSLSLI